MATINFPTAPATGATYTYNGKSWRYNGTGWALTNGQPYGREVLAADRTYYVATTGNDANNGLTVGTPFLTIQKAVDTVASLDISIYNVLIQLADGTYTTAVTFKQLLGAGAVTLQGNATTPANTIISTTSATAIAAINCGANWKVQYLKLQTTTGGNSLFVSRVTCLNMGQGMIFGACAANQIYVSEGGILQGAGMSYTIAGAATAHIVCAYGSYCNLYSGTTTITGTPAINTYIYATGAAICSYAARTFVGGTTGTKYGVVGNAVLDVGGNVNYLPGSVAGTVSTGGQYI